MQDLTTCNTVSYNFGTGTYAEQCPLKSHLLNQWNCRFVSQFENVVSNSVQSINDYIFGRSQLTESNKNILISDSVCNSLNSEYNETLVGLKWLLISTETHLSSIYYRLAQTLLDIGILPSVKILDAVTPLHIAAGLNNLDAMELLVRAGADINVADDDKMTPFDWAITDKSKEALEYLFKVGVNLFYVDNEGASYLHKAALKSNRVVTDYLIKQGLPVEARDNYGQTPMHWAAIGNNPVAIDALYLKGANVDARDQDDYTPLDVALSAQAKDSMKMLIECKANLSQDSKHPFDRMKFLAMSGQNTMIKDFLKAYERSQFDYPSLSSITLAPSKNDTESEMDDFYLFQDDLIDNN